MSKAREIATKVEDLRKGDTVNWDGIRHNVLMNASEADGSFTLRLQVPGQPVLTFHSADPSFTFTRIAR
jgi:hypothetical protein